MPKSGIRPVTIRCTLNCTWWPLAPSLTLHEVNELGNRAKSVQECLLISVILVAPYSTNMHTNHKITSQTTSLKCTWWPLIPSLTLHEVSQLGNRTKSVQECLLMSIGLAAPHSAMCPQILKLSLRPHFESGKPRGQLLPSRRRTFDPDFDLIWGHPTGQQKISSGMFADIDKPSCSSCRKSVHKS